MNFFASQDVARRKTRLLLFYYVLAIAGIVGAFYLASRVIAFITLGGLNEPSKGFRILFWDARWMGITAGASLLIIVCGILWRRFTLLKGGSAIAESAGGREIRADTQHPDERRLMNVVEEIALAAGVPVPRVFVLDRETGINAFAAGFTLRDAAVAVTRGSLQRLTRDELQGVIAHEFSHILNGDMRLNSWLLGVLFGILMTAILGRLLLHSLRFVRISGNRRSKGGGGWLLVVLSGIALWLIGSVGVFFARLIQASVSRQREYLADASAVQFTRNPVGLAGALKRIGALADGNHLRCANRSELSHLLFSSPVRSGLQGLLASHPPLMTRIRQLEPAFDGNFNAWVIDLSLGPDDCDAGQNQNKTLHSAGWLPHQHRGVLAGVSAKGGEIPAVAGFLQHLDVELQHAVQAPDQATATLYALLFSDDAEVRARQRDLVVARETRVMAESAENLFTLLQNKNRSARRMVADLAVMAARQRESEDRKTCVSVVDELVLADGSVSLFEYLLRHRITRGLLPESSMKAAKRTAVPPGQVKKEVATILAVLAYVGQPQDDSKAHDAWQFGVRLANSFGIIDTQMMPRAACAMEALDEALQRLNGLIPLLKGEVLGACEAVIRADGIMTEDETELLRVVADSLEMSISRV